MNKPKRIAENLESWREQACLKWLTYKKNKRTQKAAEYWRGYAQACANARTIARGYAELEEREKGRGYD